MSHMLVPKSQKSRGKLGSQKSDLVKHLLSLKVAFRTRIHYQQQQTYKRLIHAHQFIHSILNSMADHCCLDQFSVICKES